MEPDPGIPDDSPAPVQAAAVALEVRDPGLRVLWPITISNRAPSRAYEGYASEWILSVANGDKIPWEALQFDADERPVPRRTVRAGCPAEG